MLMLTGAQGLTIKKTDNAEEAAGFSKLDK